MAENKTKENTETQTAVNGMEGDKRSYFVVTMWSTFETSPHPMPDAVVNNNTFP